MGQDLEDKVFDIFDMISSKQKENHKGIMKALKDLYLKQESLFILYNFSDIFYW